MSPEPAADRWYKSTLLVTGLVILVLGIGNWVTGTVRMREHEAVVRTPASPPTGGARWRAGHGGSSQEEIEIARGRMDFYHVVASGGRLMTFGGLLLVTFALARRLRPQAKRSSGRDATMNAAPDRPHAGPGPHPRRR